MNVLALDFDGVISDSAAESFAVALATYTQMRPQSTLASTARRLSRDGPAALRADTLYRGFVEMMPLGNRAEDFAVVLWIQEQGKRAVTQADYDRLRAGCGAAFLAEFHRRFYEERRRQSEADREGWLALLAPYAPFVDLLRRRAGDALLALATAKDRRSVGILLDAYGIRDLFPEERILDKESGTSKRSHLTELAARLAVDFSAITFVDDKVNHLEGVSPLGVRCALAAWGYNGAREVELARAQGFLVCDLAGAESCLFGDA